MRFYFCSLIIPRGFGGIRTTRRTTHQIDPLIIPRGFGGIRTTFISDVRSRRMIIPRGFGGIRTTGEAHGDPRSLDYTERIWRYQDNPLRNHPDNYDDYTERIWRYQDN